MMAGYTTLKLLHDNQEIYQQLEEMTASLLQGLAKAAEEHGVPVAIKRVGSMISLHFSAHPVTDFASAAAADITEFNRFFHYMLDAGVYLPPSAFETWFISHAISKADIDKTVDLFAQFCKDKRADEAA